MSSVLKIQNQYSYLQSDNDELKELLWSKLRWKEPGAYFTRLYKQRLWDGYTEFFKKGTGRFLTGLLPEIKAALKIRGEEYTIDDQRNQQEFAVAEIDKHFISGVELRPFQVDLTNTVIKNKRGIIDAPTGAGKSLTICSILKSLPDDCPTLITTKNTSLINQIYDDMLAYGISGAGKVFGSKKADFKPNIKIAANIDSIHKIENLLPHFRALIVDECHLMTSAKPRKMYGKMVNASIRVGVSATPYKYGGKDNCQKFFVKGTFGPILLTQMAEGGILTTKQLQDEGTLSGSHCIFTSIHKPYLPYATYQDAVEYCIATNFDFHKTVSTLVKGLKGRTLILVERLAHGDALFDLLPGALWVRGQDDIETRKFVLEKLKHDENAIAIATTGIFSTGVNVFVHNLVNAAGGKADHQIIQRMGRGLRTASDKDILNYYDFIFTGNDYLLKHSNHRIKVLKDQGHTVEVIA